MTILAFEFSSDRRSVAISRGERVLASVVQEGGRSMRTFALIAEALAAAGIRRSEVERVAVGIGPGSHTGIRMAISVALGWHLANGCRVTAVGSFAALAGALGEEAPGPWLLAADAQRREFAIAMAADGRVLSPLQLIGWDALAIRIAGGERTAGTDAPTVGLGAVHRCPDAAWVARIAADGSHDVPPEFLEPVYLRAAAFLKAPPTRVIPGITDVAD